MTTIAPPVAAARPPRAPHAPPRRPRPPPAGPPPRPPPPGLGPPGTAAARAGFHHHRHPAAVRPDAVVLAAVVEPGPARLPALRGVLELRAGVPGQPVPHDRAEHGDNDRGRGAHLDGPRRRPR